VSDNLFFDTSYAIALLNADDPHHAQAFAWAKWVRTSSSHIHVHDGVLLEIGDGFGRRGRAQAANDLIDGLCSDDNVERHAVTTELINRARDHQRRHTDKTWGLNDSVSFGLRRDLGIEAALTADQDLAQAGFRAVLHEDPPDQQK
jgi:predicted nucleic acid-binding protein